MTQSLIASVNLGPTETASSCNIDNYRDMEESYQRFTSTDLRALSKHSLLRNVDLLSLERKSNLEITIDRENDQD